MKNRLMMALAVLLALSAGFNLFQFARRGKSAGGSGTQTAADSSQASAAETWQCPMHPTIVQDHPADCPLCGMKLVKMKRAGEKDEQAASGSSHRVSYYRSPMDPSQTSMTPRKDEMGMDYVPVYEEDESGDYTVSGRAAVEIDPSRQQLIGLRLAKAAMGEFGGGKQTVGMVEVDPTRVSKVNAKISGYVEHVFVDFVGKPVMRGDPLFTLYSPELLVAQEEFLLALKSWDSLKSGASGESLVLATRKKLELWDVPAAEIEQLAQTGEPVKVITFRSLVSGVVTNKDIVEGTTLEAGATPYEITDLSTVWVLADVYQTDLAGVQVDMRASMSFESVPDRVFVGKIAFIDPLLDSRSRTVKVRINVANEDAELKPGMYGEVFLREPGREALTIPSDAIIPSGRGYYVFVALGDGKFEPRRIEIGEHSGDIVEVVDGLQVGESVVTRANFLVDSESSLRAALASVQG